MSILSNRNIGIRRALAAIDGGLRDTLADPEAAARSS
jgi:hypothetical protein